jgi:hypothetical protein
MVKMYAIGMTALIVTNVLTPYQIAGAACLTMVILLICKWISQKRIEY